MRGPVPGWRGDLDEAVETAEWWKDYLAQVIATIPLRGPKEVSPHELLKEIGPSSRAPDIQAESPLLMDSDSEEEVHSPTLLEAPVHNLINFEFPATMLKSWKIQP